MTTWKAYVGSAQVAALYQGAVELTQAYLGSLQAFLSAPVPVTVTQEYIDIGDPAPAGAKSSSSISFNEGDLVLVGVVQIRGASTDPALPTVDGLGVGGFTQEADELFSPTGTNRRRVTVFSGVVPADVTGAVTASYAADPDTAGLVVLRAPGGTVQQAASGSATLGANTLQEPAVLAAPQSADSRTVVFAGLNNTNVTRFEVAADAGGEVDYVTFPTAASFSPSAHILAGWRDGDPSADLDPGIVCEAGAVAGVIALEILPGVAAGAEPPAEEPPGAEMILLGATTQQVGGNTIEQATNEFETQIGATLDIVRRFHGTYASSFASVTDFANDENKRHRFVSLKEGSSNAGITQAQWKTFLLSIPNDGYLTYVTGHHEPDNDGGAHTTSWFKNLVLATLHAAWVEIGSPAHIIPSFCLTSYKERDGNGGTSSADWFPDASIINDFVFWIDPYDPNSAKTLEEQSIQTIDLWKAATAPGTKWGIAETGTKRTGADGVAWINNGFDWARTYGDCAAICWFDSSVGAEGPWYLPDGVMSDAYGAQKGVLY